MPAPGSSLWSPRRISKRLLLNCYSQLGHRSSQDHYYQCSHFLRTVSVALSVMWIYSDSRHMFTIVTAFVEAQLSGRQHLHCTLHAIHSSEFRVAKARSKGTSTLEGQRSNQGPSMFLIAPISLDISSSESTPLAATEGS